MQIHFLFFNQHLSLRNNSKHHSYSFHYKLCQKFLQRIQWVIVFFFDKLTFKSPFNAIKQVGWNDITKKCVNGNQNQYCKNTNMPTTLAVSIWPLRVCKLIVTLRPPTKLPLQYTSSEKFQISVISPASSMPWATIAPNFAITSSCLSVITLVNVERKSLTCTDDKICKFYLVQNFFHSFKFQTTIKILLDNCVHCVASWP